MKRHTGIWIAAALLHTAASASAGEVSAHDRFRLWNECRPTYLLVEGMDDEAAAIGLTKDAIEIAVRSRLRAARLYNEDLSEGAWSYLYINVNVTAHAFSTSAEYMKQLNDVATGLGYAATTWDSGAVGTHGRNSDYILRDVAHRTDRFIDEYLRVNEDACK